MDERGPFKPRSGGMKSGGGGGDGRTGGAGRAGKGGVGGGAGGKGGKRPFGGGKGVSLARGGNRLVKTAGCM